MIMANEPRSKGMEQTILNICMHQGRHQFMGAASFKVHHSLKLALFLSINEVISPRSHSWQEAGPALEPGPALSQSFSIL